MFFLLLLLDDKKIRIHISDYWICMRIRKAQKHMDLTDPDPDADPQHCRKQCRSMRICQSFSCPGLMRFPVL
jgi:hypothetical protein